MKQNILAALLLAPAAAGAQPSELFVDIADIAPGIIVEMAYAGTENFIGDPIDGYHANKCLLTPPAAQALALVEADLAQFGLHLKVLDCYRPQRAVDHFARWAADTEDTRNKAAYYPTIPKAELFERGYIAARSGHSRGSTMDLTIDRLDMGGRHDLLDPRSNTLNPDVGRQARANRMLLKLAMEKHGFVNYPLEWWHYTLADEPYPDVYFDRPVE
ncbi:MAG: D-Ala-D-Ala dipeptidase VanX-Sc [Parvularculaceae bacterium]